MWLRVTFGEEECMKNQYLPRLPGSEAFFLNNVVECRANQVVSLTVYRVGGDGVVMLAFDAGEGVSQETLDEDCLYWVLEGEVVMIAGDSRHPLLGGDCFVVPARMPHAIDIVSRSKVMVLTVG